jgi:hypothetical protein
MKERMANWLFNFWYNNHTHYWIAFDPNSLRQKCRYCKVIKTK